jgi:hypothetical protein
MVQRANFWQNGPLFKLKCKFLLNLLICFQCLEKNRMVQEKCDSNPGLLDEGNKTRRL